MNRLADGNSAMAVDVVRSTLATPDLRQAATDEHLVGLWLHGRPPHTQRAYNADAERFFAFVARSLPTVTLGDVQAFADSLASLAPSSRARTLAAIKSLLS